MKRAKADTGGIAEAVREVFCQASAGRPNSPHKAVTAVVRDVLRKVAAGQSGRATATGRTGQEQPARKVENTPVSPAVTRLKLARSLAEVRTNIAGASGPLPPPA